MKSQVSYRNVGSFTEVSLAMVIKVIRDILFPGIGVRVEDFSIGVDELTVVAAAAVPPGRCPDCRGRVSRVHSTYQRRLAEQPAGPYAWSCTSRSAGSSATGAPARARP